MKDLEDRTLPTKGRTKILVKAWQQHEADANHLGWKISARTYKRTCVGDMMWARRTPPRVQLEDFQDKMGDRAHGISTSASIVIL